MKTAETGAQLLTQFSSHNAKLESRTRAQNFRIEINLYERRMEEIEHAESDSEGEGKIALRSEI